MCNSERELERNTNKQKDGWRVTGSQMETSAREGWRVGHTS